MEFMMKMQTQQAEAAARQAELNAKLQAEAVARQAELTARLQAEAAKQQAEAAQRQAEFNMRQMEVIQASLSEQLSAQIQGLRESFGERRSSAPPPRMNAKVPLFDIVNDKSKFITWKSKWGYYLTASGIDGMIDDEQRNTQTRAALQMALSDETIRWLNTQGFTQEESDDAAFIITRIEEYIKGSTNPLVQVVQTIGRKQGEHENFENFVTDIKERAKFCGLEDIKKDQVRDWFITTCICANSRNTETRKRLLLEKDLRLEKAVEIGLEEEKAARTSKQLGTHLPGSIAAASSGQTRGRPDNRPKSNNGQRGRSQSKFRQGKSQTRNQGNKNQNSKDCPGCGRKAHNQRSDCPAWSKQCNNCKKTGHFAHVCRSKNEVSAAVEDTETTIQSLGIGHVEVGEVNFEPLETIKVEIITPKGRHTIEALPDTGANVCALPPHIAKQLSLEVITTDAAQPKSADGSALKVQGSSVVTIKYNEEEISTTFLIINRLQRPILSRQALKALKVISQTFPRGKVISSVLDDKSEGTKVETQSLAKPFIGRGPELDEIAARYPAVFSGRIRTMRGPPASIELTNDAVPCNTGCFRDIPEAYKTSLKRELDLQVEQGIIEAIEGPTEWLHPIVVVPKKGTNDIRLCVDLRRLNQYAKRPVNPQPTPWEVVRRLPRGVKHFAVFDALKGYHQIELDEESRNLTSFWTPFGRYRYVRLAMGYAAAGDIFTMRYGAAVDNVVDGRCTEDAILVAATRAELIQKTEAFIKTCNDHDITLNVRKIQWDVPEALFGGFVVDHEGYRIDPALIEALRQFPTPKSQTDVRSFMGLANQTCNFSRDIAKALEPLKDLLKKNVTFTWQPEHQAAFEIATEELASPRSLAYYDPSRRTRLIADASRLHGLGFVLKQEVEPDVWKTVQAGSRFITPTESRYAMIELELLGVAWAAKKTAMFIEGLPKSQLEIWTDHKPLVPILESYSLAEIPNKRLQRLRMKIDHLQYTIKWIKGKDNIEADALSRAPVRKAHPDEEMDEVDDAQASAIISAITNQDTPDELMEELRREANKDEEYIAIRRLLIKGFPKEPDAILKPFCNYEDEISQDEEGLIFYRDRLFVPKSLRKAYLDRLIGMHQGAGKLLQRARRTLWWPFMKNDINNAAKSCRSCAERTPSNPAEPLLHHEDASYAFQAVHADLAMFNGQQFLIVVDQYSGFPLIYELGKHATTKQVTDKLAMMFSAFGIPERIFTDGGPQFLENGEFDTFCKNWFTKHIMSSPHHSQSNGIAESAVKQMKKIIAATFQPSTSTLNKSEALKALLLFRNTPRDPTGLSPAQILFGRDLRDILPTPRNLFRPNMRYEAERRWQEVRQKRQEADSNSTRRELDHLRPGQVVLVQNPQTKRWTQRATIISFGKNTREYIIRGENGREYRRNRIWLKPWDTPFVDREVTRNPRSVQFNAPEPSHANQRPRRETRPTSRMAEWQAQLREKTEKRQKRERKRDGSDTNQ